jgi:hypothetical protein
MQVAAFPFSNSAGCRNVSRIKQQLSAPREGIGLLIQGSNGQFRLTGDSGDEQRARTNTDADALREEGLPEGRTQGKHYLAEDNEEGSAGEEGADVAHVVEGAGEEAKELDHECLNAPDPGDGAG